MKTLSANGISFSYSVGTPFEKQALDNVTVSFTPGKITGVIGHTGSGKSTLLEMISGLQKPMRGEVLIDGENLYQNPMDLAIGDMKKEGCSFPRWAYRLFMRKQWKSVYEKRVNEQKERRFSIGLVMQYPEYQLFDETVLADICYGPKNMGKTDEEAKDAALRAAVTVGLPSALFDKSPFEISGGEKRRTAIAGVLAMEPEILILDEPAAGLDPIGRKKVFEGISQYNKTKGATVILVSHSMEDLAKYCDEVVVMHQGKVVKKGSVEEIFSAKEELARYSLDVPQISAIAEQLLSCGIPLAGDLFTVDGVEKALLAYLGGGDGV